MNRFTISLVTSALILVTSLNAEQVYTIQNQSLKDAIEQISKKSNIPYMVKGKLLEGKKAPNIKNIKGIKKALSELLKGTNLEASIEKGTILIKNKKVKNNLLRDDSSKYNLGEVDIVSSTKEGLASEGYLVKDSSRIGSLKGGDVKNTPYSLNIMSKELMENLQATSPDQVYITNPSMQMNRPQSQNASNKVLMRGFSIDNAALAGLKREEGQYAHNINIEEYEQLESITGLSGFLYGASSVGGILNYVPKRPYPKKEYSFTLGNGGGKGYYAHVDLSSPLDEKGKLSYRLNVVTQDGNTHVENQSLERNLVNLAVDYKLTDNFLIQMMASKSKYRLDGRRTFWNIEPSAKRPSAKALDSNKLWGQKWTFQETEATRYLSNIDWKINDNINLRAAYLKEKIERVGSFSWTTVHSNGLYSQSTPNGENRDQELIGYSANIFLDFNFETYGIDHELTTGFQKSESYRNHTSIDRKLGVAKFDNLSLHSPIYLDKPKASPVVSKINHQINRATSNLSIGDKITINPKWSFLLGASHITLEHKDKDYEESILTPSISLIYKPIPELTTYITYIEGIEFSTIPMDIYRGKEVLNSGQSMNPLKSKQIEIGTKWSVGNMLFTTALFEIDKGLQYYKAVSPNKVIFSQDGRQVNRGLEFTLTGKLSDNLTVFSGLTLLDPKIKKNKQNTNLEGKKPMDVADKFAKLYLEYSPFNNLDLSFNGGLSYTGDFYGDNLNTDKLPGYTLFNLGTRYTMYSSSNPLTFKINVNNLTNKDYWINSQYLGDKRTVHASVSMKF